MISRMRWRTATTEKVRRTCAEANLTLRAAQSTELPAGVCGHVEGVALVYDVVDTFRTRFRRGCLDRTRRERLAAGKVKLFWDHGDAPISGMYDTDLHIGTVRSLEDRQLPDGRWCAWMTADLFDTEKGRECKEYLRAVLATGGDTGLSVGVKPITALPAVLSGQDIEDFTECYLGEISITAMSSVPGTQVTAVRAEEPPAAPEPEPEPEHEAAPVDPPTAEPEAAPAPADPPADLDYEPLLRGIHAAVGDDRFRVLLRGILGDALTPDSAAATPAARNAASADSRPVPTEGTRTDLVPLPERLAFARSRFVEMHA